MARGSWLSLMVASSGSTRRAPGRGVHIWGGRLFAFAFAHTEVWITGGTAGEAQAQFWSLSRAAVLPAHE
jgi:hypothetical protein